MAAFDPTQLPVITPPDLNSPECDPETRPVYARAAAMAVEAAVGEGLAGAPLSKSALKRQKRKAEKMALRAQARAKRKKALQQAKQQYEKEREAAEQAAAPLPAAPPLIKKRVVPTFDDAALPAGPVIAVDMTFDCLMRPKEVLSMSAQIMQAYGRARRAAAPLPLVLAGPLADPTLTRVQMVFNVAPKSDGRGVWSADPAGRTSINSLFFAETKDIATAPPQLFAQDSLVYLTPDTDNVLESLDPAKVYIVGGFVDKNRFKGLTAEKARVHGIPCAALPIGPYIEASLRKTITVNQVIEVMLAYNELADWEAAFNRVLPPRKQKSNPAGKQKKKKKRNTVRPQNRPPPSSSSVDPPAVDPPAADP